MIEEEYTKPEDQEAPADQEATDEIPEAMTGRLIKRVNGEPFATKQAADLRGAALRLHNKFTKTVVVEGGYALEVISRAQATGGKKRIPIGTRQRLTAPSRRGYVRRFVNDEGDRIKRFVDAGWTPVTGDTLNYDDPANPVGIGDPRVGKPAQIGGPISEVVDRLGKKAYLMEIPSEWYDEDMREKMKPLDDFENQMRQIPRTEGHYGKVYISQRGGSANEDPAL